MIVGGVIALLELELDESLNSKADLSTEMENFGKFDEDGSDFP